jgi:hypothetical protein
MNNQITHRFEGASCGDSLQNVLNHNATALVLSIPEGVDKKEAMFSQLLIFTRETLVIGGHKRDIVALWKPSTYLEALDITLTRYNELPPTFEAWWLPGRYGFSKTNAAAEVDFLDEKHFFVRANSPSENVWVAMKYYFWETLNTDSPKENTDEAIMKYYEAHHDDWVYCISSIFRKKHLIYPISIDSLNGLLMSTGVRGEK